MEIVEKVLMGLLCLGVPMELSKKLSILAQSPGKVWRPNGSGNFVALFSLLLF